MSRPCGPDLSAQKSPAACVLRTCQIAAACVESEVFAKTPPVHRCLFAEQKLRLFWQPVYWAALSAVDGGVDALQKPWPASQRVQRKHCTGRETDGSRKGPQKAGGGGGGGALYRSGS